MLPKFGFFYISVLITLTGGDVGVNGNGDGLNELYSKLLNSHNFLVPPSSGNISVFVNLELSNLLEVDTRKQEMTFTAIVNLNWSDSSLSWNRSEFSHINRLTVPSDKVWTPNILIWNSNSKNFQLSGSDLSISADGQVHWPIFGHFKTACTIDVTYYPFDQQTCVIKIGSTDRSILIGSYRQSTDLEQFYMSVVWDVVEAPSYSNVYKTNNVDFPEETDVSHYLIIRRRTHWLSEVCPSLLFAFITIIPAIVTKPLEKLILQVFSMAGLFALHMDLMNKLPPTMLINSLASQYIVSLILCNLIHLTLTAVLNNRRGWFQWIAQRIPFQRITKRISRVSESSNDEEGNKAKEDIVDTEEKVSSQSEGRTDIFTILNWIILVSVILAVAISTLHFLLNHPH